jgi:hypothetical protein
VTFSLRLDSSGPLHRHPQLEKQVDIEKFDNEGGTHVIVDEKDWKEGRETIRIIRDILTQKDALPTLLGLNPELDKKIHKALEE